MLEFAQSGEALPAEKSAVPWLPKSGVKMVVIRALGGLSFIRALELFAVSIAHWRSGTHGRQRAIFFRC